MTSIRVAGAQIDLTVGDLSGNEERIREAMVWAEEARLTNLDPRSLTTRNIYRRYGKR